MNSCKSIWSLFLIGAFLLPPGRGFVQTEALLFFSARFERCVELVLKILDEFVYGFSCLPGVAVETEVDVVVGFGVGDPAEVLP